MVQQHYDQWQINIHLRNQIIKFKNSTRKNDLSYNKTLTFTLRLTSLEWKNYHLNTGKQFILKWSQDEKQMKSIQIAKNTIHCHISHLKIKPEDIIIEIRTPQNTQVHWPYKHLLTQEMKLGKGRYEQSLGAAVLALTPSLALMNEQSTIFTVRNMKNMVLHFKYNLKNSGIRCILIHFIVSRAKGSPSPQKIE